MIQLRYIRPSIWIPSCELAWSFLVMAEAGAKNVQTVCKFSSRWEIKILTHQSFTFSVFLLVFLSRVHFQDILLSSAVGMLKANWERE
jgi:hypothetical protein